MDRTRFHISTAVVIAVAVAQTLVLLGAMSNLGLRISAIVERIGTLQQTVATIEGRVSRLEGTR